MKNSYRIEGNDVWIKVPLPGGGATETVIDLEDLPVVSAIGGTWRACIDKKHQDDTVRRIRVCYATRGPRTHYKHFFLHRVIANTPPRVLTDHKDLDQLNNRRSNLRHATRSQNRQNSRPPARNQTGYKGVVVSGKKWIAQITADGKNHYLGTFPTIEEAARAYDAAAIAHFGDFARPNLPTP